MVRRDNLIIRNIKVFDHIFIDVKNATEVVKTSVYPLSSKAIISICNNEDLLYSRMEERTERRVMSKEYFYAHSSVSNAGRYYK